MTETLDIALLHRPGEKDRHGFRSERWSIDFLVGGRSLFGLLDGQSKDLSGAFLAKRDSVFRRTQGNAAARDLFGRQQILSIVFDVELIFLARKRGYRIEIVPIRWADKRGSRMRARPGLAMRVAWDLFRIPLIHRRVARRVEPASVAEPPAPR